METCIFRVNVIHYDVFKSYYVVWKLSIYVHDIHFYFLFKSYYVVWKPSPLASKYGAAPCLNRTM